NQITQRKPRARSDDLAKLTISFHVLTVSALSKSALSKCSANSHCEYVVHGGLCSYSPFVHLGTDRSATLLFNFKTRNFRCLFNGAPASEPRAFGAAQVRHGESAPWRTVVPYLAYLRARPA